MSKMSAQREGCDAKVITRGDLTEVAEGVYYSQYSLPLVDAEVIAFLKQIASTCSLRRARFCAHPTSDSGQHDMVIVTHRDSYVMPHRHLSKSETFVVIEGVANIILFEETGSVDKIIKMGPPSSDRPFFYRMPPRRFHSLVIESELLVFLESTTGPFRLADREHASWAPHYDDATNGRAFLESILQKAAAIPA